MPDKLRVIAERLPAVQVAASPFLPRIIEPSAAPLMRRSILGRVRSLLQGAEPAGEEDERIAGPRATERVDLAEDDPVVAGGVLGDGPALEAGQGVGDHLRRRERPYPTRTARHKATSLGQPSGLTDEFSAPCWSVRRIPTHGRLTPCGN
jgi:hypothetical protein